MKMKTKSAALKKVEAGKAKHEQKWGKGWAKIEEVPKAFVLVVYLQPDLTYKQAVRGRYGLGRPIGQRGRTKKEPRWVVRYVVRFETP